MFLMAHQPKRLTAGRSAVVAPCCAAKAMMMIITPTSEAGRTRAS